MMRKYIECFYAFTLHISDSPFSKAKLDKWFNVHIILAHMIVLGYVMYDYYSNKELQTVIQAEEFISFIKIYFLYACIL